MRGMSVVALAATLALSLALPRSAPASAIPPSVVPVLAFYYTWYHPSTFCRCTMSDLPVTRYDSNALSTIDRQISEAADAGLTGFIASWPGPGNTQDAALRELFDRTATFQHRTHRRFVSAIYFESDAVAVRSNLRGAMEYAIRRYTTNPNYFRWQGKPVIFIWDPLGGGRTLRTWATLRREVDPHHRLIWSAEGTDLSLLDVFDGLHLYSAAYWGLLDGTIGVVDRELGARIAGYNALHHTGRIWAAGVLPGYDDTRIPGRAGTYRVPRRAGATYRESWRAAVGSRPAWITITSFNEWFEGTMIEPSRRDGSRYLALTREFTRRFSPP